MMPMLNQQREMPARREQNRTSFDLSVKAPPAKSAILRIVNVSRFVTLRNRCTFVHVPMIEASIGFESRFGFISTSICSMVLCREVGTCQSRAEQR
jgi:hypothetical protein